MARGPRLPKLTKRTLATVVLGVLLAAAVLVAARSGWDNAAPPARCPRGTVASTDRCCAPGQFIKRGACTGEPRSCPTGFRRTGDACVVLPVRVRIQPGTVRIGPGDWEAQGLVKPRDVTVPETFFIDAFEVTVDRWNACVAEGPCSPHKGQRELGSPVRSITFEESARFCRWAGGTIPTEEAWILSAAGTQARRYPWGNTGAVCRRADWGRLKGPCAQGASQPEWAGLVRADATPEGVVGLAGGVAEWVRAPDGPVVRGGSFMSQLATELRTWRRDERNVHVSYEDVGLRCMYE